MNIRHLEHLLAIAETGSFSRAAERAFITQSALSRSIRALEATLGGPVVDRIGKRNELTALGHDVVERARRIVLDAEELQRSAALFAGGSGGTIRVGLGSGPGAMLMTPLLHHVATRRPGVRVEVSRGSTELQLGQLRSRALEALVVDARRIAPAPDLRVEPLGEMRTGFIARADHPLAARRRVAFEDVLEWPVATTPLSAEVARLLVEQYGPRADPAAMATLRCEDIGALIDTVSRSQAVYLGIVAPAREAIARRRLAELHLAPRIQATARFAYVTLAGRTEAPVMRTFREFVAERLRD
ncbi:MAG: LysR family transcriptional regulator [Burkholderiaceae bacterium]|jgi:DNA-binding transcriptional LysR family regulator|nr:LysR family transcriptional regulator [Burkholderiales bacterium]MCZ8337525.1 LysR family transcriptional regulator [Burkholderiaceae bacterium]